MDGLDDALTGAELVVLALALTPETAGVLDRRRLELLAPHGWVVNVARGAHIVTDDLVDGARGRDASGERRSTSPTLSPYPTTTRCGTSPAASSRPHTANTIGHGRAAAQRTGA